VLLAVVGLCVCVSGARAASPAVSVFPSPGTISALPGTQITFRGLPPSQIGQVQVVGSRSGTHTGRIAPDSDGHGGSFLPSKPFAAGETVTVKTGLNVMGASNGTFSFGVATPAGRIGPIAPPHVPAGAHGIQRFHTAPGLQPPAVQITKRGAPAGLGDIFVAPQFGPSQDGPMVLDTSGNLVWFHPIPRNMLATDFRVQHLFGKPVLTWWQGFVNHGSGRGVDVIYDTSYRPIATVKAANGLQGADLHEFLLTNNGDAYIIAVSPLHRGRSNRPTKDSVVQEIDIKTGLVLFEWHALDHIPLNESFFRPSTRGHAFDPFHANSVDIDRDGNLIVSLRNTWAVYKIDHNTGAVIWTLGSSRSTFRMGPGTRTAFQHDAIVNQDGTITMFDDGAGPPAKHKQSRAIRVAIDLRNKTARLVKAYDHSPRLLASFEGGAQPLARGDLFVGWGAQPYFSEFNSRGRLDFDARFVAPTTSYRAYRLVWHASPANRPGIAWAGASHGLTNVYASWNGATDFSGWRLLEGSSPTSLSGVRALRKHGFETAIGARLSKPYIEVQALGRGGRVLATSPVRRR
jgi:hypothetical protein